VNRRAENRPVDENDFADIKMFADGGLHWSGIHSWFGRPVEETRRYVYDAWPELFTKIENNTARFLRESSKQLDRRHA